MGKREETGTLPVRGGDAVYEETAGKSSHATKTLNLPKDVTASAARYTLCASTDTEV